MTGLVVGVIIFLVILMAAFVGVTGFFIFTYNKLVRLRNSVKNSFAQIETQLQRRFDLIPNLVEAIHGYTTHEIELLETVSASRSAYINAGSNQEKLAMNTQLTTNLHTLFALAERDTDLKQNANFLKLQEELAETEDRVTFSRQFYNDAVTIYNNQLQMFPNNLIANMFGFQEEVLFDFDDDAGVTEVKF